MFKLPTFEMPTFDLGSLELPTFPGVSDLPSPDLTELPTQIAGAARDAAYLGVGLVVMTVERLQAAAGQLQTFGEEIVTRISELVSTGAGQAREAFSAN